MIYSLNFIILQKKEYMKKILLFSSLLLALTGCSDSANKDQLLRMTNSLDSIQAIVSEQAVIISSLRDSVELLKFPSKDRLIHINNLLSDGKLDQAEKELGLLVRIFPNSQEAHEDTRIRERISSEREKIKKEKERLAALGFRALPQKSVVTVDYNTVTLSSFSCGDRFIFDSYGDEWFYRTADRDNKYVTMAMSVRSTSKSPNLPQFAVYSINGSTMKLENTFQTEYARWSDYGSYLGNYHDNRNDFSKVSTVSFKLGAEVSQSVTRGAYAIVMYNKNVLTEQYDRFKNPPQYWIGRAPFASSLSIDSFQTDYVLIKIFNLK